MHAPIATPSDSPAPGPARPFLAADVGGTHARVALVRADACGGIEVLEHSRYQCGDYPGLAPILADFLAAPGRPRVDEAAIACAGILRDEVVTGSNLPWAVPIAELRKTGIARVAVVNDFVAVAHASQCMRAEDSILLTPHASIAEPGPTLVIGPGTGLGAAFRVPCDGQTLVLPSEASHMAFAAGTAREIDVLAWLQKRQRHVPNQDLISGPGLLRLYQVLCQLDGAPIRLHAPADIPDAARRGDDARAIEAVNMFCGMFGNVIADLAIACCAGSVFIAGGIASKIRDFLDGGQFLERFLDKSDMAPVLQRVPIHLIDNPHKGVIGAASWHLAQRNR